MDSRQDVPMLKPSALFEERASRDKSRLKAYNQLLEQIYNRVKTSAQVAGNTWIIYTVPPFVFGLPKIDLEDCVVYLVFQMRQAGYEVRYTYPNLLFISWKHHERNYILQESPIMKAMLPPVAQRQGPVAQRQGPRQGHGEQEIPKKNNAVRFAPPLAIMGPRSAGEYEPPTSFVNAISGGLGENPDRRKNPNVLNDLFQF